MLKKRLSLPFLSLFFQCFSLAAKIPSLSMASSHSFEPRWESRSLSEEEKKVVAEALCQSYSYLNAGSQSIAFLSEDRKYVLKFFKNKPFCLPESRKFLFSWSREKALKKRLEKRDKIFSAYKTACDKLRKETGILYVHFNQTDHLQRTLHLSDASGEPFSVSLDECDFALGKNAEPLYVHLNAHLERADIEGAGQCVGRLLELQRALFEKAVRNRDIEFTNNYGFIDGHPVLFDVGRLLPCVGQEGKEKYQKKMKSFLPAFRSWIQEFYPLLLPSCDRAIADMLYVDPEELSMTSFHPFQQQWEAKMPQQKEVIKQALSQPYHYLASGGQSVVFASEDGNYVLKFFKEKIFSIPTDNENTLFPFFSGWKKKSKCRERFDKRDRIYRAYRLACDTLAQETATLYVHLNTTEDLHKALSVCDSRGKTRLLELDECDFILQKRAKTVKEHLDALLAQGERNKAGESLKDLLNLHATFAQKAVYNRDIDIFNNYGFVGDVPILLDAGRLLSCRREEAQKKYEKQLKRILPSFLSWVALHYPSLISYGEDAVAQISEKSYP